MLDHVIDARMHWEHHAEQIMVAVDFKKAYDSVSFSLFCVSGYGTGYGWGMESVPFVVAWKPSGHCDVMCLEI